MFAHTEPVGAHEASVIAYRDGQPVGVTLCLPDLSSQAGLVGDRELLPEERLNLFGIGVVESARGTGLNLAIAARSFLDLVKRGNTHISYTLVVGDNWPSRRTAEKLGARGMRQLPRLPAGPDASGRTLMSVDGLTRSKMANM